jgi:hypothetical protein
MCPHAQDADDFLVRKDLVDQTMMDIDPARVGARQVTDQMVVAGQTDRWPARPVALGFVFSSERRLIFSRLFLPDANTPAASSPA